MTASTNTVIGMVMFPNFTHLDLTGPFEVFGRIPQARVFAVAAAQEVVASDTGLNVVPDLSFEDAPPFDVICVPGGPGVNQMLEDEEFLAFLSEQGRQARFVTSVCSGALLLGAAGLLRGYRAATHWLSMDLLPCFGAVPVAERVVVDRNRITGGGVTAGIDFGLTVAAMLAGEDTAKRIQLMLEYNPAPPFSAGSPETADPHIVQQVRAQGAKYLDARREAVERIAGRRPH
ncbi:MAG: DJ-1/PfpI family protein [Gemmatimonadetes bacterium]|nr:DJ-1/PfpI family protein [Gemmatimonadota bacterium]